MGLSGRTQVFITSLDVDYSLTDLLTNMHRPSRSHNTSRMRRWPSTLGVGDQEACIRVRFVAPGNLPSHMCVEILYDRRL